MLTNACTPCYSPLHHSASCISRGPTARSCQWQWAGWLGDSSSLCSLYFPHQLTSCRECEEDLGSDILGRLWLYTEIAWIPEWPCGADPICWPHIRLRHEQKLNLYCIHFWHLGTICYNSRPIPGWLSSFAFHLLWIQWFVFNSQTSKLHLIFQTRTTPTPLTLLAAKFTWKHRCSEHT